MECKFTLPKKGGKAIWEITNQCNYLCKYCIFSSNAKKDINELNTEECFHIIDDLNKNNFKTLKITGGEPFIRKDIIEIINYAKDKKMFVDISTNASLITDKIATELKKTKVDKVHVSLDGYNNKTQEEVRGPNTFLKTLKGIEKLRKQGLYIRIGTIIYKENENKLKDIIRFVINLGANEIIFSIMEPLGRMAGDYSKYKTKSQEELTKLIETLQKEYKDKIIINYNWKETTHIKSCPAGKKFVYINNLGQVSPCTWKKYLSKDNLKTRKLKELLEEYSINKHLNNYDCHTKSNN